MKRTILLLAALAMVTPLQAQTVPEVANQLAPASEATVRKVDLASAKITLRHGPIANLDMPPMTMVFGVRDVRLLDGLKVGQRVRFDAEKLDGVYTVTRIEVLP